LPVSEEMRERKSTLQRKNRLNPPWKKKTNSFLFPDVSLIRNVSTFCGMKKERGGEKDWPNFPNGFSSTTSKIVTGLA